MSDIKCLSDKSSFASGKKIQMMIEDLCEFADEKLTREQINILSRDVIKPAILCITLKERLLEMNLKGLANFVFIPMRLRNH